MGGKEDGFAVVGRDLSVKGVEGLSVVDCSIAPQMVGANTQLLAYMIGEKGSDLIKKRLQ